MKNIILAAALLTGSIAAFAGSSNDQREIAREKNITTNIRSQIVFPDFLRGQEGEHSAAIIFKVTDCGTIHVQKILSDDADLRSNLLNQSEKIKVNTRGLDSRDTYKVVVKFETL